MKTIVVATKNQGKLREIKEIFKDMPYRFVSMEELGIDIEVDEDADTFLGNATKKATEIMKLCGKITMADDSGLCVDALGGAPGVYSARYSKTGNDLDNNLLLLKNMEGTENRNAHFTCAMVVAFPDGTTISHEGEFHGTIGFEMKGTGGFGYDCLFYLPEYGKTSAEITAEQKNSISHRAMALKGIKEKLKGIK
ncbi:MAG: RdgB/HAM1 family non-canonical purine NTP pyrophosphatase [Clostridia bacterium]|nr:RdgB/HAM1 family non-canonical purine NTP pyrophosphatase [Clostridia bacterium]